jgi:hypothetical protein
MDISRYFPSAAQKRLEAVARHLDVLQLSDAETKHLSYAISSRSRVRAAKTGKIRTVRCPTKDYARIDLKFGSKHKKKYFHCLQGAAFPHLCGRITAQRPTWDHISNERGVETYMHAENLQPASHSEQRLNQTVNDNPVEGRPLGSAESWQWFPNPGRAANELARLVPGKNWNKSGILRTADQERLHHQGWEFRWPEGSVQVRTITSAPSEAPLLEGELWRAAVLPDGAAVPSACRVSTLGRWTGSHGHIWTPSPGETKHYGVISLAGKKYQFHQVVAATFADLIGAQPSAAHTVDHKNRVPTDNRIANLRWEDKSAQALNQTVNDNPVEGRPLGSAESWQWFPNPGRAANELARLVSGKSWSRGNVAKVADQKCSHHQGWEFRWPEGSVQVRRVSSAPSEAQWRDDGAFVDEEWARLEPRADGTMLVTPELRDASDGTSFVTSVL